MSSPSLRPEIRWKQDQGAMGRFVSRGRAKGPAARFGQGVLRRAGLFPVSLFHMPNPELSRLVRVQEPEAPYRVAGGSGAGRRVAEGHVSQILSLRARAEIEETWEGRVGAFLPDHADLSREALTRLGPARLMPAFSRRALADQVAGFSGEFSARWGEALCDTFLFSLEIACRYGSELAGLAVLEGAFMEGAAPSGLEKLERTVAGFDLSALALFLSLEGPESARLSMDTAVALVLVAKRAAAHAFGVLRRCGRGGP